MRRRARYLLFSLLLSRRERLSDGLWLRHGPGGIARQGKVCRSSSPSGWAEPCRDALSTVVLSPGPISLPRVEADQKCEESRTQFPHHPSSYHIHLCIHAPMPPPLLDPPGPPDPRTGGGDQDAHGRKGSYVGKEHTQETHGQARTPNVGRIERTVSRASPSTAIPKRASRVAGA